MVINTFGRRAADPAAFDKSDACGAPVLCDETIYTDAHCRVRKIWTWGVDSLCQDRESSLLMARLGGKPIRGGGQCTFASVAGKRLTDQVFERIFDFHEGLARVMTRKNGYGYIDRNMELVIPMQFDSAEDFQQGFAGVCVDGEWFYIGRSGRELPNARPQSRQRYQELGGFREGMGLVSAFPPERSGHSEPAGTWGFIDETGREVIPPQYTAALGFLGGIAIAAKGKRVPDPGRASEPGHASDWVGTELWGGIDKTGKEVIPFVFDEIQRFEDCTDAFMAHHGGWKKGHWGVIDRSGRWLAPPVFADIKNSFHDGLFAFYAPADGSLFSEPQLGVYDCKQQRVLFAPQFADADILPDGGICVSVLDKKTDRHTCWILDRNGKARFPSAYTGIDARHGEPYTAELWNGDEAKYGLIDRQGRRLLPCVFDHSPRQAWLARPRLPMTFTENGKQGLMELDGKVILPARYDQIGDLASPFFTVSVGDEQDYPVGMAARGGRFVIPARYRSIGWCRDGRHFYCCRPGLCEMYEYEPLA